jgi:hypothetical protein
VKEPQGAPVTLRHERRPGDLGMVTYLHSVVYAREFGLERSGGGDRSLRLLDSAAQASATLGKFLLAGLEEIGI